MAVTSLEELQRQQRSGVRSLTDLQAEAAREVEAEQRDPIFGQRVPVHLAPLPGGFQIPMQLFTRPEDRAVFGQVQEDLDTYWGDIVGMQWRPDAEGKLQAFYQVELGFSPQAAQTHGPLLREMIVPDAPNADTAAERIGQYYRNGQIQVQLADLGREVLMSRDTPATWEEINRLRKLLGPDPKAQWRAWYEKFGTATAEQLPLMAEVLKAAPVGGVIGGLTGLTVGAAISASPTIGEELLIPALTWSGVKTGAGVAGAYRVGQLEAGMVLLDLLDAGVDPAIAKSLAVGVGILNGALEMAQFATLLKTLPGGRGLMNRGLSGVVNRLIKEGTLRNVAARHATQFGGYLTEQLAQELAQESVNIVAEEFGKWLTEEVKGDELDPATLAEIVARYREISGKSLRSFTVLGIPGSAVSTAVDVSDIVAQRRAQAWLESWLPDSRISEIPVTAPETPSLLADVEKAAAPPAAVAAAPPARADSVSEAARLAAAGIAAAQPRPEIPPGHVTARVPPPAGPPAPPRSVADAPAPALLGALQELSYAALADKARQIGVTVRGKKAQLAALIADAIKAKAGLAKRTRIDRQALADTEAAIRGHGIYQEMDQASRYVDMDIEASLEGRTRRGRVDPERVYYIEPRYRGELEEYLGQAQWDPKKNQWRLPRVKGRFLSDAEAGFNRAVAVHLTFDKAGGQAWDLAMQEQGLELDLSEFLASLGESLAAVQEGKGGINEPALAQALESGDPYLAMLVEKRRLLRTGRSGVDINQILEQMGRDAGMSRDLYQDLLVGEGMLADPDDPHPGSLPYRVFFERLGQELADKDSAWMRMWHLPDTWEKPRAMWQRLRAEWQALQAQELAADLNVGQVLRADVPLTAEQEADLQALDAEKVAAKIVEREKQTLFGRLISGFFNEAHELARLRTALLEAYRAGAAEGIASARAAYAAQQARVKAQRELREHVASLLAQIRRPVGKSVAFVQRQAIEMIQAEIDPHFRRKQTIAERRAAREYFAAHPEAQPPAKVMAVIQQKAPGELTVAQIEDVARAIRELKHKGKILRRAENAARAERLGADVKAVRDAVTGGKPPELDLGRPILRPPTEGRWDRLRDLYVMTLTPERIFDWLDRQKNFLGATFQIFWDRVADAEATKLRFMLARRAAAVEALKRLDLTYADLVAPALDINGETLTVEQAVGVYNFGKNLASRLAITFGNRISLADQRRVGDYVENARPELKTLADWIIDHYQQHYARLRQAVIDAEDRDMGREENYTPERRMEVDYTPDERQILSELMQRHHLKRGYAEKGMTLHRKDIAPEYQKPIRLDAFTLLLEQIERQEHYIAMAAIVKDLHAVLRDESVKGAIVDRAGSAVYEVMRNYVDAVGNPNIYRTYGQAERLARRLRRNTAVAFLAYKLSTMLKMPVSMVRYLPHAGLHLLQAGMEAAGDWSRVRAMVIAKDPFVGDVALERELEEFKAAHPAGYEGLLAKIGEQGLAGLTVFDAVGRTIGWYGTYLHEMAIHGEEARAVRAARRATSLSQAGARVFQLPELYRSSQEYLNLLTQFTNELNKLWNIATYDLVALLKNAQYRRAVQSVLAMGLEAAVLWAISNRRLPEEEELPGVFGEQFLQAIPVLGNLIIAARRGFGGSGVPAFEGAVEAWTALERLAAAAVAGELDDATILDAAHDIYRGVAPVWGLPYTGPRDLWRTVTTGEWYYLLGGRPTPPPQPQTKASQRAAVRRKRGRT